MTEILLGVCVIGLLAAVGVGVWLFAQRQAAARRCAELAGEAETLRTQLDSARAENTQLSTQIAVAQQKQADLEQKQAELRGLLDTAQAKFADTFDALAGKALQQSSEQFLKLAGEKFAGLTAAAQQTLEARQQAIDALLAPVRQTLEKYNTAVQTIEVARERAYAALQGQLQRMTEDQQLLQRETRRLVDALKKPDVRGRWGEVQLRRVVELAGMIDHCDFYEQQTVGAESKLRPDLIVKLPGDRTIVIDAKTPLDKYIQSLEASDDAARTQCIADHCRQVMQKVDQLSRKDYVSQFDRSPDFVVLFIPGEPFLQAAVQVEPTLIEAAMEKRIVIATPSTLMALLRAVAVNWREQKIAENAQKIEQIGRELHERIVTALEPLHKLGASLTTAVAQYNKFVGSFESRLLPSARKFEELGARSAKALPDEPEVVEATTRPLSVLPAATAADAADLPGAVSS